MKGKLTCPNCSRVFESDGTCADQGCTEKGGCAMVRCPSCQEEFRPISPLVRRIAAWLKRGDRPPEKP